MDTRQLFLASDSTLKRVVDRIGPDDLGRPVPAEWTRRAEQPVLRDVLAAHAYDEAWVPDVLAGRSAVDADPWAAVDLLGDDPVTSYGVLQERATAAATAGVEPGTVLRFSYGDFPAEEGFAHLATYRAFQAWSIAHLLRLDFRLAPGLVEGLEEHVLPQAEEWRARGVFPPAIEPPPGADAETVLLCKVGYWQP